MSNNTASQTGLLLSIRPRFADLIFNRTKHIELRRRRPRVKTGDLVFVYVSSPVMALIGAFEVKNVVEATPAKLWKSWNVQTGLTRKEFDAYFAGRNKGFGLVIANAWRLPAPVKLASLRKRHTGFRPPQAYHYFPLTKLSRLGGVALEAVRRN
jgi:predicted transcriptional regulator